MLRGLWPLMEMFYDHIIRIAKNILIHSPSGIRLVCVKWLSKYIMVVPQAQNL